MGRKKMMDKHHGNVIENHNKVFIKRLRWEFLSDKYEEKLRKIKIVRL
jgi:hypothetical protein